MMQKINFKRHAIGQINQLSNKLMTKTNDAYQKNFGISSIEWRIIVVLFDYPDIALNEVSDLMSIDNALVSRTLKKLTAKNYLIAARDSADKRTYKLRLTDQGRALYHQAAEFSLAREDKFLTSLSENEVNELFRLIHILKANADSL